MDFMNLNQSAHGDREFGHIATRLRLRAQDGRRPLAAIRPSSSRIGAWARAACGWHEAQRARVARFGDNMRQVAVTEGDKVEAQIRLGISVNGYGVGELVDAVRAVAGRRRSTSCSTQYERALRPRPGAARRAATGASRCATPRGSRLGLRGVPRGTAASRRSPTRSRISTGSPQLPGHRRPAADGRRLRLRRRGRLEDGGARPAREGDGAGLDGRHVASWRTTRTTSTRRAEASSARTCSRSARRSPPARPSCEIHPLSIGGKADPVRLVFTAAPGPGRRRRRCSTSATASGWSRTRSSVVAPDEELPRLPVARAVWRPQPDLATAAEAWLLAGGAAPHGAHAARSVSRRSTTSPRSPASSCS